MSTLAQSFAVVAILTNGIVYGTEVFAAIVQRSALAHVDDRSLTSVMGYIHHYAGQRLSPPGIIGLLTAIVATVLAAVDGQSAWIAGAVSVAALLTWLTVFTRVTAPLDKQFATAALNGRQLPGVRELQRQWDGVIGFQAVSQTVAVAGLCLLIVTLN